MGLRLASKRGCVVKKHPQVGLRVSFPQQIQHSHSESILCFLVFLFDSFAPAHLIRRFSQPAPPSELPCGSLSRLVPKSRFTLRANLRLLLIRAIPRRLILWAACSSLPCDRPTARVRALAPALGCVYPSHPWFKKSFRCAQV